VSEPIPTPILDRLPNPPQIRDRLAELATEANFLRALLRLLEGRACGQHLLRQRRAIGRQEVPRA
jgi:hypothetical protein